MSDKKRADKLEAPGLKDAAASSKKRAKTDKSKKKNIFARIGRWFTRWFKELKSEAKKINWPTFKNVLNNTAIVVSVVVLLGGLIVLVDLGLRSGLGLIIGS